MARQENIIHPTRRKRRRRLLKSEQERYTRLVRKSNISVD
jgi:hypothetical protein